MIQLTQLVCSWNTLYENLKITLSNGNIQNLNSVRHDADELWISTQLSLTKKLTEITRTKIKIVTENRNKLLKTHLKSYLNSKSLKGSHCD